MAGRTDGRSLMKVENRGGAKDRALGDPRRRETRGEVGVKNRSDLGAIGEVKSKPRSGRGGWT